MKIGKYEFASEQEALQIIDNLGFDIDENGNKYPTHKNSISHLKHLVVTPGAYDDDFNEVTPPVFSDKYSVDVMWETEEHPSFTPYYIEVVGQGSHGFGGWDYQEHKVR